MTIKALDSHLDLFIKYSMAGNVEIIGRSPEEIMKDFEESWAQARPKILERVQEASQTYPEEIHPHYRKTAE